MTSGMSQRWLLKGRSWYGMRAMVTGLRYFRFLRAIGGHANDGDQLLVALAWDDDLDLTVLLTQLDIPLREHTGRPSTHAPSIEDLRHLGQPGWVDVDGTRLHVRVEPGRVVITISGSAGNPYEVTEADVAAASRIEEKIDLVADRVLDPPEATDRCVHPGTWPEFWEE